VFLEADQRVADTNVLANTKVLALNKMRGELIIGGRLGYFGATTVSQGISQQEVEFLEVGTQLRFRPFIGDDDFVRWRSTRSAAAAWSTARPACRRRRPPR
jgi:type II secretory pathway component HofQ